MEVIKEIPADDFYLPKVALSIGVFDGLHLGHRRLLGQLVEFAQSHGLVTVVLTFSISPSIFIAQHVQPELITTEREKTVILNQLGITWMWTISFDETIQNMTYLEFWKNRIDRYMHVAAYFCGDEHTFGKNKGGTVASLAELSRDEQFQIFPIHVVQDHHAKISSSHIRHLIKTGRIAEANQRLGYPYMMQGLVSHGDGLGRKLGYPTANLVPEKDKLIPPPGVYRGTTRISGHGYQALIYIGRRPTITRDELAPCIRIEIHLLDFNQDIYGQELQIYFQHAIRDDKFFNTIDALRHQINHDVLLCRQQPLEHHEMLN